MTQGHIYNHLILHTQHVFTLSLLVSLCLTFGNFTTAKTEPIPSIYRQELLGISAVGTIIVLISTIYDIFSEIKSKVPMSDIFKELKGWHHVICLIFFLAVTAVLGVYLNQGNIPQDVNIGIAVVSGILAVFTLGTFIYCFNKTLSNRKDLYINMANPVQQRAKNQILTR